MTFRFYTKKILLLVFFSVCSSIFAYEWGGLFNINEDFSMNKNEKLSETEFEAALWFKVPFSESGNSYFITEGKYDLDFTILKTEDANADFSLENTLDLTLFKFYFSKKFENDSSLSVSLGRFPLTDLSGIVLSQNADGILAKYSGSRIHCSLYGAYTGLLNKNTISMIDDSNSEKDVPYEFSDKFIIATAALTLPNFAKNQTVAFEGLFSDKIESGDFKIYGTAALSGPLTSSLFYNAASTFEFNRKDSVFGNLTQLDLTYYTQKSSSIGISGVYASPDFSGFTKITAVEAKVDKSYRDLLKAGVKGSLKPSARTLILLSSYGIFDTKQGDDKDEFGYSGVQLQGSASFQFLSDLNVNFSVSQYLGKNSSDNKTSLKLKATVNF